jgi:type IV fimbrial biogenesis protein FimT
MNDATRLKSTMGFSLFELMLVVAIVGILMALTVPSMATMIMQSKLQSKADTIATGLARARAEAYKRNANVTVTFASASPASASTDSFVNASTAYTITCQSCSAPIAVGAADAGNLPIQISKAAGPGSTTALATYSATFDSFGNRAPLNPDGTTPSIEKINLVPSETSFGVCSIPSGATISPCQIAIHITNAGSAKICKPSLPTNSTPFACPS